MTTLRLLTCTTLALLAGCASIGTDYTMRVRDPRRVLVEARTDEGERQTVLDADGRKTSGAVAVESYEVRFERRHDDIDYAVGCRTGDCDAMGLGRDALLASSETLLPAPIGTQLKSARSGTTLRYDLELQVGQPEAEAVVDPTTGSRPLQRKLAVTLSTDWANVREVRAIERGDPVWRLVGRYGALASTIGAGFAGYGVYRDVRDDTEISALQWSLLGGTVAAATAFLLLSSHHDDRESTVYGESDANPAIRRAAELHEAQAQGCGSCL